MYSLVIEDEIHRLKSVRRCRKGGKNKVRLAGFTHS